MIGLVLFLCCAPVAASAPPEPEPSSLAEIEARGLAPIEATVLEPAPAVMLRDAHVMTATGVEYERGWVLLEDGLISALGEGDPPDAPGVRVLSLEGQTVTPGLIDPHSHIGVYAWPWSDAHDDGNEGTSPLTAGLWAEHSVKPHDPAIQAAVAGGVTTVLTIPGSANLIGGRGVVLHLVPHRGARAMRFPGAPEHLKMACGENPKRVYGRMGRSPATRMGNLHEMRQAFLDAEKVAQEWDEWEASQLEGDDEPARGRRRNVEAEDPPDPPDRNLSTETLVGVLRGEILPQVHCYRVDDMLDILQLADELGFSIRAFHHATSAYKIRDILAERNVATVTWSDWWGFKMEALDGIPAGAALVHDGGARVTLHSDSPTYGQILNQEAAKAWREGVRAGLEITQDEALSWVTLQPAWVLGIEDVTGSLEPGKRADVVVWTGHPFSVYSKARLVFIDGVLRHDIDQPTIWSDFQLGREVRP